jgi:pilus assembly protein CpaC
VSLRDGQSFSIAGLLQTDNARNIEQLPWLGQLPVLGALFRSTEFQKSETDLVILVTPRLVSPVGPDTKLASPLDNTRSSNDVELFLYGMLEVDRPLLRKFREGEGVVGPYGHIIELDFDDAIINKK